MSPRMGTRPSRLSAPMRKRIPGTSSVLSGGQAELIQVPHNRGSRVRRARARPRSRGPGARSEPAHFRLQITPSSLYETQSTSRHVPVLQAQAEGRIVLGRMVHLWGITVGHGLADEPPFRPQLLEVEVPGHELEALILLGRTRYLRTRRPLPAPAVASRHPRYSSRISRTCRDSPPAPDGLLRVLGGERSMKSRFSSITLSEKKDPQ